MKKLRLKVKLMVTSDIETTNLSGRAETRPKLVSPHGPWTLLSPIRVFHGRQYQFKDPEPIL
jgi:hypothetical protein